MGKLNLDLANYNSAVNNYKLSIEKGLDNYSNNYYVAMSLFFTEKYKEAKDYMIKALEIEPNNFEANLNLGVIYRLLENYDNAIKYYDEAIKINNKSDIAYINKAEAAVKNNADRNLIEGLLNIAISLNSEHKNSFKIENKFKNNLYEYLYYVILFEGKKIAYSKHTNTIFTAIKKAFNDIFKGEQRWKN